MKRECPGCSAEHMCDPRDCWCTDYPLILSVEEEKECLCPSCLKARVQNEIDLYIDDLTSDKIKRVQALGKPKHFFEDIDYTINEDGNWVFSSWYLLRQGACCSNGCANCPYPKSSTQD